MKYDEFVDKFLNEEICVKITYQDKYTELYYYYHDTKSIYRLIGGYPIISGRDTYDVYHETEIFPHEILSYSIIQERSYHE